MTPSTECLEENQCSICEKSIDEEKDNYETVETYLDGGFEDVFYVHTDCRYEKDKAKQDIIDRLNLQYKRYEEFVNTYKNTMASRNLDSNFAENLAIYQILYGIVSP